MLAQPVLHTDDTPIRTLVPGTGKTRLLRFWVYAVDPHTHAGPGRPPAFYRYSPDRNGERQHRHMQTEVMAELTPPLIDAVPPKITTEAA